MVCVALQIRLQKIGSAWFIFYSVSDCYYIKYNTGLEEKKEKYNKNDKLNKKAIDKHITYMLNYSRTRYNK